MASTYRFALGLSLTPDNKTPPDCGRKSFPQKSVLSTWSGYCAGAPANARHVTPSGDPFQAGLWSASQNIAASRIKVSVPRKPVQNQGERAEIRIDSKNLLISGLSNLLFPGRGVLT